MSYICKNRKGFRQKYRKEYQVWRFMKTRCSNPKVKAYPRYGGRGIKVCKCVENFEDFMDVLGPRPEGLTLERVDNNGDYCKMNIKWASQREQQLNRDYSKNRNLPPNIYPTKYGFQVVLYGKNIGHVKSLPEAIEMKGISLRSV